jgi:hypothetical protein
MQKNNTSQSITSFLKVNQEVITELGICLHEKMAETDKEITLDDCIGYIRNLTINRTYDGYIREKSVVNDGLAKIFPNITFEESPPELDHSGDVDYLGHVGEKAFGIQIKPITAKSNFGNYSMSERMKLSFEAFTEDFGGKVFIVFSNDGEIGNTEVIEQIAQEIKRLENL